MHDGLVHINRQLWGNLRGETPQAYPSLQSFPTPLGPAVKQQHCAQKTTETHRDIGSVLRVRHCHPPANSLPTLRMPVLTSLGGNPGIPVNLDSPETCQ